MGRHNVELDCQKYGKQYGLTLKAAYEKLMKQFDRIDAENKKLRERLRKKNRRRPEERGTAAKRLLEAGHAIRELIFFLSERNMAESAQLAGCVFWLFHLRMTNHTRFEVLRIWLYEWNGILPADGTRQLADKTGITERAINNHLNRLNDDPLVGPMLTWDKKH